ncbi:hypothetical protein OIV83_002387 [Microbotryomycetes sp. JL201]|nr:hypothetical protein OIV83_002387 [Microbotryomycetes sp. JL201]
MKAQLVIAAAVLLAYTVSASNTHEDLKRAHLRRQRAWGRRQLDASVAAMINSGSPTAAPTADSGDSPLPTVVPDVVTGDITISNTQAAAPQQTAAAKGADRGDTSPLPACSPSQGFGEFCDQASGTCWCAAPLAFPEIALR